MDHMWTGSVPIPMIEPRFLRYCTAISRAGLCVLCLKRLSMNHEESEDAARFRGNRGSKQGLNKVDKH